MNYNIPGVALRLEARELQSLYIYNEVCLFVSDWLLYNYNINYSYVMQKNAYSFII